MSHSSPPSKTTYVNPGSVIGTSITFIVLGAATVTGRFFVRRIRRAPVGLDDWFALAALVLPMIRLSHLHKPTDDGQGLHSSVLYDTDHRYGSRGQIPSQELILQYKPLPYTQKATTRLPLPMDCSPLRRLYHSFKGNSKRQVNSARRCRDGLLTSADSIHPQPDLRPRHRLCPALNTLLLSVHLPRPGLQHRLVDHGRCHGAMDDHLLLHERVPVRRRFLDLLGLFHGLRQALLLHFWRGRGVGRHRCCVGCCGAGAAFAICDYRRSAGEAPIR